MIATNICILGICFLIFMYLYFPMINKAKYTIQDSKCYKISHKKIIAMLITFLLLAVICNIHVFSGGSYSQTTSTIHLLYSYFDSPSFLAILLVCATCFKQSLKLVYLYSNNIFIYSVVSFCERVRFNVYLSLILFIYGCILYGGSLGMLRFDIYHLQVLYQCVICFLLLVLLYVASPQVAYLGLFALLLFYICRYENMSVLESFMCPYLWVYCALYMIYAVCKNVLLRFKYLVYKY